MLFQQGEDRTIKITELAPEDVIFLLKCQCKMKCLAIDSISGEVKDFIYLLDRTDNQKIICAKAKQRAIKAKKFLATYDECRDLVGEVYVLAEGGKTFEVRVSQELFEAKKEIFNIFNSIRKDIYAGLVSLDYQDEMWTIKMRDQGNFVNIIYYWPKNNYLYMVTKDNMYFQEPSTQVTCIEDLLC